MNARILISLALLPALLAGCAASGPDYDLKECDLTLSGVRFTHSLNGAATQVSEKDGIVTFRALPKADYFRDPNGDELTQDDAAILLTEVDNTKPFTFSAKVTPGFTPSGLYHAATLFVFDHPAHWQKFAFEQDERGKHRIVTVRTVGTSDDNNHDVIEEATFVWLKISSDTRTLASYYSLDGENWQMVRLYKNDYPGRLFVGICSQAPQDDGCISTFEYIRLTMDTVSDFRMGNQ